MEAIARYRTVGARLVNGPDNPLGPMSIEVTTDGSAIELRPVLECWGERHELLLASFPASGRPAVYTYARQLCRDEPRTPMLFARP